MTDTIVVNEITSVVEVTSAPASTLQIVKDEVTVVVQALGIQGPPGPKGDPGEVGGTIDNASLDGGNF